MSLAEEVLGAAGAEEEVVGDGAAAGALAKDVVSGIRRWDRWDGGARTKIGKPTPSPP